MLPSDLLAGWVVAPDELISDPRALHLWDEGKVAGRWYEENVTRLGAPDEGRVEWDAYFLYGPETTWGDAPPEHVSWGRTIVDSRDRLLRDVSALLGARES